MVPISDNELKDSTLIKRLAEFDTDIEIKLGKFDPGNAIGDSSEGTIANTFTQDEDEDEEVFHPLELDATAFEIGEIGEDLYDHYIAPRTHGCLRLGCYSFCQPVLHLHLAFLQ